MHIASSRLWFETEQMNRNCRLTREHYEFKLGHNVEEAMKINLANGKEQFIIVEWPDGWRISAWIARMLNIRLDQVGCGFRGHALNKSDG